LADVVVAFSGVTKRFGDFLAVDDLSFALPRGSISGFLGPNGAGKTTSLRLMLGILTPDAGDIRILGRPSGRGARSRVGYLPEERGLYRRMRALSAITYVAKLKGMPGGRAKRRALALLERFGLGDFARVRMDGLSKGMAQKVQIITSVVHDPEFVILDEPFSGLDPVNQMEFQAFVRELADEGKTILFSTHTMDHAERLCDQLIILAKGRKRFDGTLDGARALLPRRARIGAEADLSFLGAVKGVTHAEPPASNAGLWVFVLAEGVEGRPLLAACFEHGIVPWHFEVARPSLQEIFVSLVGADDAQLQGARS
jgi:ABC-2 type transport system ATP-binding protein